MLSAEARARLAVVLVGARNPQNIGAAARAMQDFGFSDLRVVNDYASPFEAAQLEAMSDNIKSAVGAANVMQAARRFKTLVEAISDCTLVVGTTAIGGRELHQEVITLQQTAPHILDTLMWDGSGGKAADTAKDEVSQPGASASDVPEVRVALLFGSEKTGLTNDQLSHCSMLTTIPMFAPQGTRHLSMNLGQSVAVCLYELVREGFEGVRELPEQQVSTATAEDRERLTELLLKTMRAIGYSQRFPASSREHIVRQLAMQLGCTRDESAAWMGFLRHVLRYQEKSAEADASPV